MEFHIVIRNNSANIYYNHEYFLADFEGVDGELWYW